MKKESSQRGSIFFDSLSIVEEVAVVKPTPKLKSSGKRLRSKLKRVNIWVKKIRDVCKLKDIWKLFCLKLVGHIRYFGVSFNIRGIRRFINKAVRILFKWLNRRSQRKSFTWKAFMKFMKMYPLPEVKMWHKLY